MKKILIVIAVLIILFIGAVVGLFAYGFSQIDKIAKSAIEYGGTYAMGVETTVDEVDVAVTKGTVNMVGLNIANPQGFETSNFFTLESSQGMVEIESISTDTIIIPTVVLSGIDVTLDKGNDPSNYNQILENLSRFESDEPTSDAAAKEGKNVIIKSLILEDINIHIANMPGVSLLAGDVAITIPEITLENIGEKESMKTGDVINLVVKTVLAAAVESGGGIIPGDILGELGNGLAGLSSLSDLGINAISDLNLDDALNGVLGDVSGQVDDVIGGAVDDLGKQGEEIQKQAEDVVKDVQKEAEDKVKDVQKEVEDKVDDATNKLKGIFGGKKDGP